MDSSIHERLVHTEKEFLHALAQGGVALEDFDKQWTNLLHDINNAIQKRTLTDQTKALANNVSSRVAIFSEGLFNLGTSTHTIQTELDDLFARIEISEASIGPSISARTPFIPSAPPEDDRSQNSEPVSKAEGSWPTYIEPAYDWLIENLHNPYPSKEIRDTISHRTSCPRKDIDVWFIETRKRIGWNTLRRRRFSNKRIDIIDAATRFFFQVDPKRPLDPDVELEFATMETRAKDLYAEKFSGSALAVKLDMAVKDMTLELKAQMRASEKHRKQQERKMKDPKVSSSYPSDQSRNHTPENSLPSSLSDDDNFLAPHKRRNPSPSSSCYNVDTSSGRPGKRPRLDIPSPTIFFHDLPLVDRDIPTCSLITQDALPTISSTGRKRRLSYADEGTPKRPRNALAGPRHYAVSDPLPSSPLSEWFKNFDIPRPPVVDEIDLSLPLEVELYDYSNRGFQTTSDMAVPHALHPYVDEDTTPFPVAETLVDVTEIQPNTLSISTNDFDYTELFWESENVDGDPERDLANIDDFSLPGFQPSEYNSNPFDPFVATFNLMSDVDTAVIADSSRLISQDPTSSFDWIFPPLPLPYNAFNSPQPIVLNDLSHGTEPMGYPQIGLSCDHFSQIPSQTSKVAKQIKLMQMKEATRRLEAEIAAS